MNGTFQEKFEQMRAFKIGLAKLKDESDKLLIQDLDKILQMEETDSTLFYRQLSFAHQKNTNASDFALKVLKDIYYADSPKEDSLQALIRWLKRYFIRCEKESVPSGVMAKRMNSVNPVFLPRNYLIQEILDELDESGSRSRLDDLMTAMQQPYSATKQTMKFFKKRPEWARNRPGCSALSCSS